MRSSKIGPHVIEWDSIYYIAYAGGQRDLPEKDAKEYRKIINLPWPMQRNELKKFGFDKNPNVIPVKGLQLIEVIKDAGFIPFFDTYFNQSHLITVHDEVVYESIKQKSYDLVKGI